MILKGMCGPSEFIRQVTGMKSWYGIGIVILVLGLLALPVSAAGENTFPVLDNQVQVRQAHLVWKVAEQESGMAAAIGYIDSLEGTDCTKLFAIYLEFAATAGTIGSLDTHIGLNAAVRKLVQNGVEFRLEALKQMLAGKGKLTDLRTAIKDAAGKDKAKISALELAYWDTRASLTIENFLTRVDRAQKVLDALKAKGFDTTQPQATLDAIKGKKGDMQAALDARDADQVRAVWTQIHDLSKQLVAQVKDLQVRVPEEKKVQFWINAGDRAIERSGPVLSDLELLGIDTSTLKPSLAAAKDDLQAAKTAFAVGNLKTAEQALKALRSDFKDLADAYRDLVGEKNLSEKNLLEVRSMAGALDATVKEMQEIA